MKFWWFLYTSLLIIHSLRSVLRSAFFLEPNHCRTVSNSGSSFWAAAQLVTCISTTACLAVTHISCSKSWLFLMMAGLSLSAHWDMPMATPSKTACMASGGRRVVTRLIASATAWSHPFWYSCQKSYLAKALTQRCPVASRLGVDIMYVKGLLSLLTRKGWYSRYSLKCSVMAHFSAKNSSFVEW